MSEQLSQNPLSSLEEWDDAVAARYAQDAQNAQEGDASREGYRNYDNPARDTVRTFYKLNHAQQTKAFAQQKRDEYGQRNRRHMGVWEAAEFLNTLVDDSDPDTDLSQLQHLLQTAEAIRADGHPRWFILAGFVHDLGKILCLYGEPQWAVVGDTFPLGCAFSDKIVYPEFFAENPDQQNPAYQTECGVYTKGCGLDQVTMSWGHDEYIYLVTRDYLPEPALYMLRYHSFYAAHKEQAYDYLLNDHDRDMFQWVRAFNPYDLYSKTPVKPDVDALRPFYQELIAEFFPPTIAW